MPLGSPPHGRGKELLKLRPASAAGITPAWAGKSLPSPAGSSWARDHPRVGGEKGCNPAKRPERPGSPPHGRGKAAASKRPSREPRITPAWAGKRLLSEWGQVGRWDHPRMGGEKQVPETHVSRTRGSPPHGRGKGHGQSLRRGLKRITPAWAGKRRRCCAFRWLPWDHPRVGGEKPVCLS